MYEDCKPKHSYWGLVVGKLKGVITAINDDGTFESAVVTDIGDDETITFEVMLLSGEIYTSAISGNYCVKLNGQHKIVDGKLIMGVDLTYKSGGKFYEKKNLFDFSMLPDDNDFGTYSSMQCFTDFQVVTLLGNQEEVNQNQEEVNQNEV